MVDPGLLRFLEVVQRELEALDARVELGGLEPTDPRLVSRALPSGGRVVAVFASPPGDRAAVEEKLETMVATLGGVFDISPGSQGVRTPPDIAGKRLDDELARLSEKSGSIAAIVFDLASPVVWGSSKSTSAESTDTEELFDRVIARVREAHSELRPNHTIRLRVDEKIECAARPFAGLYVIALVMEGLISEPVAFGALLHAMPAIERFVLALPPVDPPPGGAKIMRMPVRLR